MMTHRLALAAMLFLLVNAPYAAEPCDEAQSGENPGMVHFDAACSATVEPQSDHSL